MTDRQLTTGFHVEDYANIRQRGSADLGLCEQTSGGIWYVRQTGLCWPDISSK